MKKIQSLFLALVCLLMGYSASLHAEDIDVYVDNSSNSGVPNVLFVLDNGANFSANANGTGCAAYTGTTEAPSLGSSTASSILQCALVNAINALPDGTVNIGLLTANANSFGETQLTTDPTKGGYHDLCNNSANGGCVLRKLALMNTANKASLIKFIKGWQLSGQSSVDNFVIKVNSAVQSSEMQEAWAYYNGKTGLSGTTYSPSILAAGCQKNFIIYVSNTEKDPDGSNTNTQAINALSAGQVGATVGQLNPITGTVKFVPSVCSSVSSMTLTAGNSGADEWSRLMYQQDGGANGNQGLQNITSYSIAILGPSNKCSTETLGMMSSIAQVGGGKSFRTSNVQDLTDALNTVLNEVQAVNSVFSSASLPVSVNADGTYLNQIYLGMFRPDASANPRWMGNLKQYQLIQNSSGAYVMGDAGDPGDLAAPTVPPKKPKEAISSAGTGFISPDAVSFWTYKDTSTAPDKTVSPNTTGGFWVNDQKGQPLSGYDSPDGEVVEKGGVAQQLRKENLTADFTAAEYSSSNPRRLYTYCPSGASCNAHLNDSTNAFATTNAGIPANAFGAASTLTITSLTRSGSIVTVTTNTAHGFSVGTSVTITGADQNDYNGPFTIATVPTATTFTLTGFRDYPTTPSAGTYIVSPASASLVAISSMSRTTSTSGSNATETVTVNTGTTAHGFAVGDSVTIGGASDSDYNQTFTVASATTYSFTFNISITPSASATGWSAQLSNIAYPAINGVTLSNPATGTIAGSTSSAHNLHVGQTVVISGASNSKYNTGNGTWTIATVPSNTSFTITGLGNSVKSLGGSSGTVTPQYTAQPISLSRAATTESASATATGAPSGWFGANQNDTKIVIISKSGASASQSAYAYTGTVTCANTGCTNFTYPIAVLPSAAPTAAAGQTLTAGKQATSGFDTLIAGAITRSTAAPTTATITGLTAGRFTNGQSVTIAVTGTARSSEAAYLGTWPLSCSGTCTTATFGPVTLTPTTPATGTNLKAYSDSTPPDKATVIRWMRGQDNYGDEKGPGGAVTVRPSIHGDVLHSRPVVLNYGGTTGLVAFYGANDGVFRAINANKTAAINSVPAGGELWGLVLPEHYPYINRLRTNYPELKFPSTLLASAQPKNYFVDGPTGVYQKLDANNAIAEAYIYMTMRRGGAFMYGLNVSTPTDPQVRWKISAGDSGFEELGQTWSRPKLSLLQGTGSTAVIVFGGGYDTAEDQEPPAGDTMGRGVYVVNAKTGAVIWSATKSCTTSATCLNVPGMNYAVPSDITFLDRDGDGYIDTLYFGDLGGNVWRASVADASTANWTVTKVAALGCDDGGTSCGTLRKFFYPPAIISVGKSGVSGSYDLISIASGDREHPLRTNASYNVQDKFFMIVDRKAGNVNTSNVKPSDLSPTNTGSAGDTYTYSDTAKGFYIAFPGKGEKGVNAPNAVNGWVFFATNRPVSPTNMCAANLGEAKNYAVSPFTAQMTSNVLAGGGLPPSSVSGIVNITKTNDDGTTSTTQEKFCIGCAMDCTGNSCSPLQNDPPAVTIPKNLRRTYWYKK
jgi:type IV pilus assembly protein PilY1